MKVYKCYIKYLFLCNKENKFRICFWLRCLAIITHVYIPYLFLSYSNNMICLKILHVNLFITAACEVTITELYYSIWTLLTKDKTCERKLFYDHKVCFKRANIVSNICLNIAQQIFNINKNQWRLPKLYLVANAI